MKNFLRKIFGIISKIIFVLIVAIIMIFCVNNVQTIKISLEPLPFEIETRLFLLVLICFFGGVFLGFLSCSFSLTKEKCKHFISKWKIGTLKKKVNELNNQESQVINDK
ncbi:MAG: hypothetical protein K0R25_1163 [Rickettsiaceae bacterium]|jgi:uncharacterized membrane protein YciS (DUF1049 family)|nr:hypothetical protein [Rickettsiaceae bacterium]